MDLETYLRRIDYRGSRAPDLETLRALHRAHLLAVPFENLDIGRGVPIVLDLDTLYAKIVGRRRGGFCYELNGTFAELLRALGYTVELLSAQVYKHGAFGPEFDHLMLRVTGEQLTEPYLADVGFGQSFLQPLRLVADIEQVDEAGLYRLVRAGDDWTMQVKADWAAGGLTDWTTECAFTLTPRAFSDFAGMCHYQQIAPDSHFTRGPICTRASPDGRLTLSADKLTITRHGQREERPLADQAAFAAALRETFGITL